MTYRLLSFFIMFTCFQLHTETMFTHTTPSVAAEHMPTDTSHTSKTEKTPSKETEKIIFEAIPFHAKYKIELDKKSHFDPGIHEVHGTLEMTVEDKGDSWMMQQKSTLYIYYKGKKTADKYDLTIASCEAKDGQSYEFYVRSISNDTNDEYILKGDAKIPNGQPGYAQFNQGDVKTVTLPKGTLFPLNHLHLLIQEAIKGNITVGQKKVMDGSSDAQEVIEVDAYITPETNDKLKINISQTTSDQAAIDFASKLKTAKAWQIKMNVFPLGSRDSSEPEYNYTQTVNNFGIPLSMRIKYPDPEFTVKIKLTDFGKATTSNMTLDSLPSSQTEGTNSAS